jgi:peptidyl-prolyl cis-trans isomerase D
MDIFRNRGLSSAVYGTIIVATVLVFVIQFRPNANQRAASIREICVASVHGSCIDPKSYHAAYRMLIPRDRSGNLLTGEAKRMNLGKVALDGLVERELLIREAERLKLRVGEKEVTDAIYDGYVHVSVPSDQPELGMRMGVHDGRIYAGFRDQKSKQFDMKVYERSVKLMTGRSPTEFREWQEREILAAKVRDIVRSRVRVSDAEALAMFNEQKNSATVEYVPVKLSWIGKYAVNASQADIDAWAKDKANASLIEAELKKPPHIRHVLAKFGEGKPGAEPTAEQKAKAKEKIEKAMKRIKAGESLGAVAKDMSDDKGSAAQDGDVGDKTDGFVEPFKKAADALKPGEMTKEPVETMFGYHIIMKDDPSKSVAREQYIKAKSLEIAKSIGQRIQADWKAGKNIEDTLKEIAASYVKKEKEEPKPEAAGDAGAAPPAKPRADTDPDRPQLQKSQEFNKGGDPVPGLSPDGNSSVTKFAFEAKEGAVLDELLRGDEGFVVVRLKQRKLATKEDFDKERDTFIEQLLAPKQAEALAHYVKRLREASKNDIKIDENSLLDQKKGDAGANSLFDEEE